MKLLTIVYFEYADHAKYCIFQNLAYFIEMSIQNIVSNIIYWYSNILYIEILFFFKWPLGFMKESVYENHVGSHPQVTNSNNLTDTDFMHYDQMFIQMDVDRFPLHFRFRLVSYIQWKNGSHFPDKNAWNGNDNLTRGLGF